jgi:hypothetical protein
MSLYYSMLNKPSRVFHTIVKYSSRLPRWAIAWRAIINSLMLEAYQAILGGIHRLRSAGSLCDRMWFSRLQCPSA